MAYALKRGETVEASVRRIARGLLERAVRDLEGKDPHQAHHRIRRACKKMRALLRLVEEPLGATFDVENQWYRDFSRRLAGVRDAQAVVESWVQLVDAVGAELPTAVAERVRRDLEHRRDQMTAVSAPADLLEQLTAARRRVRHWRLDGDGFESAERGLRRGYRRARAALRNARDEPATEPVHRWRRRAKEHWYHMRLVDCFWPDELRARTRSLGAVTDDLGRYHDLAVLRGALREIDLAAGEQPLVDAMIAKRAADLASAAFAQGEHLFAERPRHFVDRLRRHHDLWQRRGARQHG